MPTNASKDTHISDYELYHIYRTMYESKSIDKTWFVKDSQPYIRMNQLRDRIVNQNKNGKKHIKRGGG
jgi:hypothetical protein|tara:strand:- start:492 stop:695 length:204 start_codon:yes stop_codon:yes gene_type:complete